MLIASLILNVVLAAVIFWIKRASVLPSNRTRFDAIYAETGTVNTGDDRASTQGGGGPGPRQPK